MKIKKIEVDGEVVYLKKNSFLGWKVVFPLKKDIEKKFSLDNFNWFNFLTGGSWGNLIILIIIILIILGLLYTYVMDIQNLLSCFNSYEKLESCKQAFGNFTQFDLNLSNITIK